MARTGGETGWALIAVLGLLAVARPTACTDGGGKGDPDLEAAIAAVLADTWPQVLDPALAEAEVAAASLEVAVQAWSDAERDGAAAESARAAAQEAWGEAMGAWQRVEVLQLGPLGSSLTAVGGQDLRDQVYAWPTVSPCAVDQETVAADWRDADFFEVNLVTVTGFAALETLLFAEPGVNACPSQVNINADGSWDALGVDGVQQQRADYALVLVGGVRDTLGRARGAWEGGFADAFAAGTDPYASVEEALNASFDALFYLETTTKDAKLGEPLGLRDCGADTCPVESPTARASHLWLAENLVGGRRLFLGGEGQGFDDLLGTLGQQALTDDILAAFDAADVAAGALTAPVDEDREGALALHTALDALADLLREDLATVLVLQVPTEAAGDND